MEGREKGRNSSFAMDIDGLWLSRHPGLDPGSRIFCGSWIPAYAGMTNLLSSYVMLQGSVQLLVTKYTPTQMITMPVMRVSERSSWKR